MVRPDFTFAAHMIAVLALFAILLALVPTWHSRPGPMFRFRGTPRKVPHPSGPKPKWVPREIIRIKAHMPLAGYRSVAIAFNRQFSLTHNVTVGKSYVASLLRRHGADVADLRNKWKRRIPRQLPRNLVWGMDLTGIAEAGGHTRMLLGIVDHGSRRCLSLRSLADRSSLALAKLLVCAVEEHGRPRAVRTDNEAVFTSRLLRLVLFLLGIRHQRSMPHCPWQNGRIERFFGTLKMLADRVVFDAPQTQKALDEFRLWYNSMRPHQHLGGRTPDEAWHGIDPFAQPPRSCRKVAFWDGMLTGYAMDYG